MRTATIDGKNFALRLLAGSALLFLGLALFLASAGAQSIDRSATLDADDPGTRVYWEVEATNKDKAREEAARLFATLYNNRSLGTKVETIMPGETPTDVMIRSGGWSRWFGDSPLVVDAILCDINAAICARDRNQKPVSADQSVDGSAPTPGNWSAAWAGNSILVPDLEFVHDHKIEVRSTSDVKELTNETALQETGRFSAIWCRTSKDSEKLCADRDVTTDWSMDGQPTVYEYVKTSGMEEPEFAGKVSAKALDNFGMQGSSSKIVAVPTISLNVRLNESASPEAPAAEAVTKSLSGNIITQSPIRTESLTGPQMRANTMKALERMGFVDADGHFRQGSPDTPLKPVTIAHFDTDAALDHCGFRGKVVLYRWDFDLEQPVEVDQEATSQTPSVPSDEAPAATTPETTDGAEPVAGEPVAATPVEHTPGEAHAAPPAATPAAAACSGFVEHPQEEKNHGTHTLGLLVDLLSQGRPLRFDDPANPPISIIHIPSSRWLTDMSAEPKIILLRDVINKLPLNAVDVVSMSISWDNVRTGLLIDKAIENLEDQVLFVVAAGNNDDQTGCRRSPACIETKNVVSVVGLDTDDGGRLKLLQGTNAGMRYHEIGALGAGIVSTVENDLYGPMSGSSQAAPIVAAMAADLVRHGFRDIGDLRDRIVWTGQFDAGMLDNAEATMIDARRALDFKSDFLTLRDGCALEGEFKRIQDSDFPVNWEDSDGTRFIPESAVRRLFYDADSDEFVLMHKSGSDVLRKVVWFDPQFSIRRITFRIDERGEDCDLPDAPTQQFAIDTIKDLVLSEK